MGDAGVEDEISREELIVGAKKLKRCSDCLWENGGDFESIAEVLRSEISHQVDFKAKYGSKVFQNDYIHARCEYFVKIATYLLEVSGGEFCYYDRIAHLKFSFSTIRKNLVVLLQS